MLGVNVWRYTETQLLNGHLIPPHNMMRIDQELLEILIIPKRPLKKNTTVKLENICTKTIRTPIPSQDYFITKTHGRLIRGDITVIGEDVDYDSDNVSLKDHSYDVYKNNEIGCEHLDQFDFKLN